MLMLGSESLKPIPWPFVPDYFSFQEDEYGLEVISFHPLLNRFVQQERRRDGGCLNSSDYLHRAPSRG